MRTRKEYEIAVATAAAMIRGSILDKARRVCENQKTISTRKLESIIERLAEDLKLYGIYTKSLADKLYSSRQRAGERNPIETAPEEGEFLVCGGVLESELGYEEPNYGVAHVEKSIAGVYEVVNTCYYSVWINNPTHWMPLPKEIESGCI